jgi:hypothetical protein
MRSGLLWAVLLIALGGAAIANAHHSFPALFDPSKSVNVSGEVTEFQFQAPHCYIRVNVTDDAGTLTLWELETTSPGQLIRLGLTPQTLMPGDEVSAVGNPSRDGRPLMRLLTIKLPNGEELRIQ